MRLVDLYILNGDWNYRTVITVVVFGAFRRVDKMENILDLYGDYFVIGFKGDMIVLENERD
jgi:hypothetical protein|nr:MAG TPA: hypothetical protein [Caudoviricetes sp.]